MRARIKAHAPDLFAIPQTPTLYVAGVLISRESSRRYNGKTTALPQANILSSWMTTQSICLTVCLVCLCQSASRSISLWVCLLLPCPMISMTAMIWYKSLLCELRQPKNKIKARQGAKAVKKLERLESASAVLTPEEATTYRALSARANYLAQDRPDVAFYTKELCR